MPPVAALESSAGVLREIIAEQARQRDTLARIERLLERGRGASDTDVLSRPDRELLGRLLPAIAGVHGSELVTSRDLATDSAPALRLVLRGRSAKSIGKLLARAEGISIGGWMVQRAGVEINVALWRVVASVSHRFESGTSTDASEKIAAGVI